MKCFAFKFNIFKAGQLCKNAADKFQPQQEMLFEPNINPSFANNDDIEDGNEDCAINGILS